MRKSTLFLVTAMASCSVFAEKPPTDVNVINQPLEVTGTISTSISDPVTVSGEVNVRAGDGISHHGKPISTHVQLQAAEFPIANAAILSAQQTTPNGGGTSFALAIGECLVITELQIDYINAGNTFPVVVFRFGLVDDAQTSVLGVRLFRSIPNADGNGQISKTFPSGLVLSPIENFPDNVKIGLETFDARVVDFAASGYVEQCEE